MYVAGFQLRDQQIAATAMSSATMIMLIVEAKENEAGSANVLNFLLFFNGGLT